LSRESQVADFQYPKFAPFNRRDRFAFRRDRVRNEDCGAIDGSSSWKAALKAAREWPTLPFARRRLRKLQVLR
jgi:hypothetical protein